MITRGLALILALSATASAEWYTVKGIRGYNRIEVTSNEGTADKEAIVLRIRNLDRVEFIEPSRRQVWLGGSEPREFLAQTLIGQVVWIDQIEVIDGENVASVYPSYERVLQVAMRQRMVGRYTLTPEIKKKLVHVYKRMLYEFENSRPVEKKYDDEGNEIFQKKAYENPYTKGLFLYDSLDWFKGIGQFLPLPVQDMYTEWLMDYLTATGNNAHDLEIKIYDMRQRHGLYRDFLIEE